MYKSIPGSKSLINNIWAEYLYSKHIKRIENIKPDIKLGDLLKSPQGRNFNIYQNEYNN